MMAKRKRSNVAPVSTADDRIPHPPAPKSTSTVSIPPNVTALKPGRRASQRRVDNATTNPDLNPAILDGGAALRASPDGDANGDIVPAVVKQNEDWSSAVSNVYKLEPPAKKTKRGAAPKKTEKNTAVEVVHDVPKKLATKTSKGVGEEAIGGDPEAEGDEEADEEEVKQALSRPPPVNSDYLPLPWKGRLGYACLNTYLRNSNPPVFSSRTCRIASILEHRHPLKDPSQPEHATKNRPDKDQPADIARGQAYVESLGLANARDIIKMLRWNEKYGIKFMRLSSEMFPFASHEEYGYKLAPFAAETLAEVGKVVAELGHRVTTHPGQYTQLGSPRKQVIDSSIRDLDYHDEMLSLLKLPPQQDRDAVMILHMGGVFGNKSATLDRFRENYAKLSQSVKNRLVLENDDVSWSVHDLLPVCQELNIPLVLDFHHHNIIFDADKVREGTNDIMELFPAITETWKRKGITQKMHYSEPTPAAITPRQRRKHSPRVATLPPCANDMDLMIEAKDKEQAVFELMRTFKLPGFERFNDIVPYVRNDQNKPVRAVAKKTPKRKEKKAKVEDGLVAMDEALEALEEQGLTEVPEEEVGMGGLDGRVYWPPGMEEWLRPAKRVVKKKEEGVEGKMKVTPSKKMKLAETLKSGVIVENYTDSAVEATAAKQPAVKKTTRTRRKAPKPVPTPSTSDGEDNFSSPPSDLSYEEVVTPAVKRDGAAPARKSARAARVRYAEVDMSE